MPPLIVFQQAFTAFAWILPDDVIRTEKAVIRKRGNSSAEGFEFWLMNDRLAFHTEGIPSALQAAASLPANLWYLIVAVRDAPLNETRIYVDGIEVGKQTDISLGVINESVGLYVGQAFENAPASSGQFIGKIDDIRIYNRVLSEFEIQALYNEDDWVGN